MGVKLDFEAVNELPNPLQPGTVYYVDHGDGTATQVVTDAAGQVSGRQIVGLMTAGTLARTGAQQSGAVKTGTTFFQKFTPTRNITLTGVTIQGLSVLSGTARIRVSPNNGSGTTELAGANATAISGGVTAPLTYTLTAGTPYIIGAYGASLSLTLSSGHTWDGLTQPDTTLITSTPTSGGWTQEAATGAQMAFLFDVAGTVIRNLSAGENVTLTSVNGRATISMKIDRPIRLSGSAGTHAFSGTADAALTPDAAFRYRAEQATTLTGFTVSGTTPSSPLTARLVTPGGAVLASGPFSGGTVTFTTPAELSPGTLFAVDFQGTSGGYLSVNSGTVPGTTSADGALTYLSTYTVLSGGAITESTSDYGLSVTFQALTAPMEVQGQLPAANIAPLPISQITNLQTTLTDHATRLTALEGRTNWTLEAVQDAVGAMLPQGTYDDAAGTVSFTFAQARTDEEIQDVVAALIQGGANVTKTYDDAGNVLTISATSSGSGTALARSTTSVTTGNLVDGTSADVLLPLGRTYLLHQLTANGACWARGYLTPEDRTADGSRLQADDPDPNAGVVFEMIGTVARWSQAVAGWDAKSAPDGQVPIRVTNLSGGTAAITLTATFLTLEA